MSLKEGQVSQIVESPDGFHLIQMIEKDGDMFNARHILLKPEFTSEDRSKAFARLDSIKNEILSGNITFEMAAKANSEDLKSRTNGGQMADERTGSAYFNKDELKPADYNAIKGLNPGEISEPFSPWTMKGRGNVVYKIIKVDRIYPSHVANLSRDYDLLLGAATEEAGNKAVEDFIKEKNDRDIYRNRPFIQGVRLQIRLVQRINFPGKYASRFQDNRPLLRFGFMLPLLSAIFPKRRGQGGRRTVLCGC